MDKDLARAAVRFYAWGLTNVQYRLADPAEYAKWHRNLLLWNHWQGVLDDS